MLARGWISQWGSQGKLAGAPGSFIVSSTLSLGVSKHVHALQECSLGFLQSSYKSHWFSNQLRGLIFHALDPGWDAQYVVWTPHSPGRIPMPVISPSSSVFSPRNVGPNRITSPSLPNSMWIFLYSLDCRRIFLPVSILFSVRIALCVVVFLICSWGKLSSVSSFSTILISSSRISFLKNL